jgi:hypothetical protein
MLSVKWGQGVPCPWSGFHLSFMVYRLWFMVYGLSFMEDSGFLSKK